MAGNWNRLREAMAIAVCSGKSENLQSLRFRSRSHPNVLECLLVPRSSMIKTGP